MTNKEILQIAMEQSALDINCNAEDFLCDHPIFINILIKILHIIYIWDKMKQGRS